MLKLILAVTFFAPISLLAQPRFCSMQDAEFKAIVHDTYAPAYRAFIKHDLSQLGIRFSDHDFKLELVEEYRDAKDNILLFLTHVKADVKTYRKYHINSRCEQSVDRLHYIDSSLTETFDLNEKGGIERINCQVTFDAHRYFLKNAVSEVDIWGPQQVASIAFTYHLNP